MSPLWPLFPGTLLLLALLAAPGGARADSAPAAARSSLTESKELLTPDVDERSCGEDDPRPTIAATTTTGKRNIRWDLFVGSYGDDITIFCSYNDASNLTIRDDDHQLQAELHNSTTIQVTLIKPDLGDYTCHCTDRITTCTETLYVYVKPAMSVTAPGVRHTRDEYGNTHYFLNHNESSYNIYCSGQTTHHLTVYYYCSYNSQHVIRTNSVNSTTLMATVMDHTEGERFYYCDQNRSTLIREIVEVIVDYHPEARDFRCVFYPDLNFECSWKSTSKRNNYTLSILRNQKLTPICLYSTSKFPAHCRHKLHGDSIIYINPISFQLKTCNTVFCSNQTFRIINARAITKLDPVDGLKVVNTSPQGATVEWFQDYDTKYYSYKVEHRLLGTDWRAVNAFIVQYEYRRSDDTSIYAYACQLKLALPCPDVHYELRVYIRYEEATLDMYWSEPATVFFDTAPSTGGEVDPACDADFREPEPTPSARIVTLHKVRDLISDERKEKRALKIYISGLKNKLAQVKALMDAQK